MEHKDYGALFIGLLAGGLFLGFLWLRPENAEHTAVATVQQSLVRGSESVSEPPHADPGEPAVQDEPPVASELPQRAPAGQVFQCVVNGQRIFSDQPCGTNATLRAVNPNTYTSPVAGRSTAAVSSTRQTASNRRLEFSRNIPQQDCSQFKEEVERIDERMRQGYSNAWGEWLREQHRQAVSRRDDCIRGNRLR